MFYDNTLEQSDPIWMEREPGYQPPSQQPWWIYLIITIIFFTLAYILF